MRHSPFRMRDHRRREWQREFLRDAPQDTGIPENDGSRHAKCLRVIEKTKTKLRPDPGGIAHGDGNARKWGGWLRVWVQVSDRTYTPEKIRNSKSEIAGRLRSHPEGCLRQAMSLRSVRNKFEKMESSKRPYARALCFTHSLRSSLFRISDFQFRSAAYGGSTCSAMRRQNTRSSASIFSGLRPRMRYLSTASAVRTRRGRAAKNSANPAASPAPS